MKTSHAFFVVGVVLIVAAVSFQYSMHMGTRVRVLEARLHRAEAVLESQRKELAEIPALEHARRLEERLKKAELTATHPQVVGNGSVALPSRIPGAEAKTDPHLEPLPPYKPYN